MNSLKFLRMLHESDGKAHFNITQMWKVKRKICPKGVEKPSAKLDEKGKLVTDKEKLKELY